MLAACGGDFGSGRDASAGIRPYALRTLEPTLCATTLAAMDLVASLPPGELRRAVILLSFLVSGNVPRFNNSR